MERVTTFTGEWACARINSGDRERAANKVLCTVLGIVKDTLVMSVVVMAGAALTLLLG